MSAISSADLSESVSPPPQWNLASRIAFRFTFVYFSLYCFLTQIFGGLVSIPGVDIPDLADLWPVSPTIQWIAHRVLGLQQPLVITGSGSGDKIFDWILVAFLLGIAALATVVWSLLDRNRKNYIALAKWFRLFLRFALASQMIAYGMVKVIPLQMPYPYLTRLVEPYGNFSPMGVLWSFIGASPSYEILCGSAELLAGVLLIIPRTAFLGSLVCAAVAAQIFVLNMTYDVPVKLLSFQLTLMALLLAAPELPRFFDFFFRNRTVQAFTQTSLFRSPGTNWIALSVQIAFGVWLMGTNLYGGWDAWHKYGGGAPRSPLYGIWSVDKVDIDGKERSPLLTDYGRWRRVIFDSAAYMSYERMDESFGGFGTQINVKNQTIGLSSPGVKNSKDSLHYLRSDANHLTLDGLVGGHPMRLELGLEDRSKRLLVSRSFNWVQEYPFNR